MVEYINYKQKKYPVRISYLVIKNIQKEHKIDFDKFQATHAEDFQVYESMLYYGLISGAKANDTESEFKREEMEDVLDECFHEFLALIPKFFPQINTVPGGAKNPVKKLKR